MKFELSIYNLNYVKLYQDQCKDFCRTIADPKNRFVDKYYGTPTYSDIEIFCKIFWDKFGYFKWDDK